MADDGQDCRRMTESVRIPHTVSIVFIQCRGPSAKKTNLSNIKGQGRGKCMQSHPYVHASLYMYIYIHAWYICISMQEKVYIIYNSYNIYACTLCYTYIYYIIYILCTVTECVYIRLCTYCILRLQRASSPHIILNTCKNATFNEPI